MVRLAGLYHAHRGAHTFFLRLGAVGRWPGYTVNLVHYEDAASMVAAVLQGPGPEGPGFFRSRVFLGTDGSPLTFQACWGLFRAALPGFLPCRTDQDGQYSPASAQHN